MSTFMTVFLTLASLLALVEFYIAARILWKLRATMRSVRLVEKRVTQLQNRR